MTRGGRGGVAEEGAEDSGTRFTGISQNRRGIRFHSWSATLTGVGSSIAIQRPIGVGALPSPVRPSHPPCPPEIVARSIPEDNRVQGSGPGTGMTKEPVSR